MSFETRRGKFSVTIMGNSTFEVVSRAIDHFQPPFWGGPVPHEATMFEIQLTGSDERFYALGRRVMEWRTNKNSQAPRPREEMQT